MLSGRRGSLPIGVKDPQSQGDWARLYFDSILDARTGPDLEDLAYFSFFIGYARSGHTLVATMLNAHPEVVIAHELDAVRFVRHRFSRRQLYSLLLRRDQQFGSIGRTWSGYQYEIPDQFQGRFERLRVIGDKRARSSVLQIAQRSEADGPAQRRVKVPIRVFHVTRNPFDNIATEARRHKMSLAEATQWYEQICRAISDGAAPARPVGTARRALRDVRRRSRSVAGPSCAGSSAWSRRTPISMPVPESSGRAPTGPATRSSGRAYE